VKKDLGEDHCRAGVRVAASIRMKKLKKG